MAPTPRECLGKSESITSLLTDPSCFRNDETNTNIFIHVDDGLLFGPRSEVSKLVELFIITSFDENQRKNGEDG